MCEMCLCLWESGLMLMCLRGLVKVWSGWIAKIDERTFEMRCDIGWKIVIFLVGFVFCVMI